MFCVIKCQGEVSGMCVYLILPLFAEAVCSRDEPLAGDNGGSTVQMAREMQTDLPWPLPFYSVDPTHHAVLRSGAVHHAFHWHGLTTGCNTERAQLRHITDTAEWITIRIRDDLGHTGSIMLSHKCITFRGKLSEWSEQSLDRCYDIIKNNSQPCSIRQMWATWNVTCLLWLYHVLPQRVAHLLQFLFASA